MVDVITMVNGAISFYACKNRIDVKNNNKGRKTFKRRKNNFKRKYNKCRNYVNFMEKERFDSSYADAFTKDYHCQDNLDINLATINKHNDDNKQKEMKS